MLFLSSIVISGFLTLNHLPAPNQEMLIISEEKKSIIGSCKTNESGNFKVKISGRYKEKKILLLCKIRNENEISVCTKEIVSSNANYDIRIDCDTKDFYSLTLKLDSFPPDFKYLNFFIDPLEIDGVPLWMKPFFYSLDSKSYSGYYYRSPLVSDYLTIKIPKGIYLLSGNLITEYNNPKNKPKNYMAKKMYSIENGKNLSKKNKADKFELEINKNITINVNVEVVE